MVAHYKKIISAMIILTFCSTTNAQTYSSQLCKNPNFYCYSVKRGDSWQRLFPDPTQQNLVMRLNRMNISLYPGMKIAVPKNLSNLSLMDISPFPYQITPRQEKVIVVSLSQLAWGAYDQNGQLENWGPVSGGQGWCPDVHRPCHTAQGTFEIYNKGGAGCTSTKFPIGKGGAPMPYCMFFHKGFALHGSYAVPGYNASHGCVRLFIDDARWLNQNFTSDGSPVLVNVSS